MTSEPVGAEADQPYLLDAMVVAAGLTSRRDPPSNSRRLVALALAGAIRLVVTERLLDEVLGVITNTRLANHVEADTGMELVDGLRSFAAVVVHDHDVTAPRLTADPDDDYLAVAALDVKAFLVTRDKCARFERVRELEFGPPGAALRRMGRGDRSLLGALRDKVTRWPDDEDWARLRDDAWDTPDPDREPL